MMTIPNTVSEFSKYAAQEFLQTAVFIDDRIYGRKDGAVSEPKQAPTPKGRPKALKSADQKISGEIYGAVPFVMNSRHSLRLRLRSSRSAIKAFAEKSFRKQASV